MKKENKQFPSAEVGIEQIEDYVILKSKEMGEMDKQLD